MPNKKKTRAKNNNTIVKCAQCAENLWCCHHLIESLRLEIFYPQTEFDVFFLDKKNSTFIQIRFAFDSKQRFFFLCFRIVDKIVVELAYLSLVYAYGLGRQWNFCVQLVNVSVCSRASDHPHLLAHSLMSERVDYSTSVEKYIQ